MINEQIENMKYGNFLLLIFLIGLTSCSEDSAVAKSETQPSDNSDQFTNVIVVGDSIGAASRAQTAYANHLLEPYILDNRAKAATQLTQDISGSFTENLNLSPVANSVIIQGGINDLISWDEAAPNYGSLLQQMKMSVETMTSEAISQGLQVMLINITPWQGAAAWSPVKQQLTEDYNAWLYSYSLQINSPMVDAYHVLIDQSGATKSIDGSLGGPIHPNWDGALVLADAVDKEIILARQ
jgi:lysophospholipase L1-like esterase